MHNQAPVLENDTHKLLWDFDIQLNLSPKTRPYNNQQKKKKKKKENLQDCRLCCPGRP